MNIRKDVLLSLQRNNEMYTDNNGRIKKEYFLKLSLLDDKVIIYKVIMNDEGVTILELLNFYDGEYEAIGKYKNNTISCNKNS